METGHSQCTGTLSWNLAPRAFCHLGLSQQPELGLCLSWHRLQKKELQAWGTQAALGFYVHAASFEVLFLLEFFLKSKFVLIVTSCHLPRLALLLPSLQPLPRSFLLQQTLRKTASLVRQYLCQEPSLLSLVQAR